MHSHIFLMWVSEWVLNGNWVAGAARCLGEWWWWCHESDENMQKWAHNNNAHMTSYSLFPFLPLQLLRLQFATQVLHHPHVHIIFPFGQAGRQGDTNSLIRAGRGTLTHSSGQGRGEGLMKRPILIGSDDDILAGWHHANVFTSVPHPTPQVYQHWQ